MANTKVTENVIKDSAVVTAGIADDAVTTAKIPDSAITTAKIADNSVTTAKIPDDGVTTAKIADDQVTLAKMAGLARGKIIYGDSSGNPAALAVGSNGQVLKSDGTDISWGTDSSNDRDGAAVFNESGAAVDFRIEGDTVENLFFVDGSADKIGIGTNSPDAAVLHVFQGSAGTVTPHSTADDLVVEHSGDGGISIITPDASTGRLVFSSPSTTSDIGARIMYQQSTNLMSIGTGGGQIFCKGSDVGIGGEPTSGGISTGGSPTLAIIGTVPELNFVDTSGSANDYWIRVSDGLQFGEAGDSRMYLKNGGNLGIGNTTAGHRLDVSGDAQISKAGDGNSPILHVIDTADTEVAWFEGNRAGDTGAFIVVRHNPSSQAESNRSGIRFQADDDGGNVTNYAKITQYIEDNTNTTEDGRLGINVMSDGSDNEVVNIRKDQFIYTGDAGSSFIRVDNRADGHDTGFEIYQNGTRRWEIHNDDSHDNQLDFRPGGNSEAMCIRSTGQVRIGVAPDIGGVLTVQKSNAGVPVLYAKNTNADSLGIRAEVNANSSNNAIIEAINSDGQQWKIRNDGDHFGSDTSIGSISDSRLKKDVSDLTYDIAKFKQYRPVEFNWINDELHRSPDSGKTRGFLAQEIGAIDTYYVDKYDAEGDDVPLVDSDGKAHSTKFGYKDAMYISVIKQLITRLEAAEAKITALEG